MRMDQGAERGWAERGSARATRLALQQCYHEARRGAARRGRPGRGEPQRLAREQSRGEPKARAQAPLGAHRAVTSESQYHARGTLKADDNGS